MYFHIPNHYCVEGGYDNCYCCFSVLLRTASVLDNMLMMMERYSNRLEEIVAERTAQLEDEKRKTDQLLYKMLPK